MRAYLFFGAAFAAFAGAAEAQTVYKVTPTPSGQAVVIPVPAAPPATSVVPRGTEGMSEAEIRRRNALYGEGWQFRTAPPGAAAAMLVPSEETAPADLSNLDQRIRADEVAMTRRRDVEFARQNANLLAIEPALSYEWEGQGWPGWLQDLGRAMNFPNLDPYFRPIKNGAREAAEAVEETARKAGRAVREAVDDL